MAGILGRARLRRSLFAQGFESRDRGGVATGRACRAFHEPHCSPASGCMHRRDRGSWVPRVLPLDNADRSQCRHRGFPHHAPARQQHSRRQPPASGCLSTRQSSSFYHPCRWVSTNNPARQQKNVFESLWLVLFAAYTDPHTTESGRFWTLFQRRKHLDIVASTRLPRPILPHHLPHQSAPEVAVAVGIEGADKRVL